MVRTCGSSSTTRIRAVRRCRADTRALLPRENQTQGTPHAAVSDSKPIPDPPTILATVLSVARTKRIRSGAFF